MSPGNKPFPIYQLQDAFESFCNGEPLAKPQHRSLYYFLLGYCRRRGNTPRFSLAYEAGMHGSGIGSWATYDAALKALAEWGFILYTPGANRYKVPVVELTFRNPTDDVLLTYWQSYCLSTSNPTDDVLATQLVTLKEVLKKEGEKVEKLESEKTQYQADVAAANAALVDSQKKIGELESEVEKLKSEIDHYATELYADPMPPGLQVESQPAAATPGGAADVGTPIEPEAPVFTVSKGGRPTEADVLAYLTSKRPYNPPADLAKLAKKWHAHYSANGWKVGKNPMKDWQAACRTWLVEVPEMAAGQQPPQANPQQHAVNRSSYGSQPNGAAARLQTPTPDATSANPWGLPAYTPPASTAGIS